jgi:hypothetical protein
MLGSFAATAAVSAVIAAVKKDGRGSGGSA